MRKKTLLYMLFASVVFSGCSTDYQEVEPRASKGTSGTVVMVAGLPEDQMRGFSQALEKASSDLGPILKASNLAKLEKWPEAIAAYEEASTIKDLEFMAKRGLSRTYEKMGQYDKALHYLELTPPHEWAMPEYNKKLDELRNKINT